MCGTAAPPYRAAPAVEEHQLDVALARDLVQGAVGAEDLPRARDHSAILVRIGVAEHDLLNSAPPLEVAAVLGRGPERATDVGRSAQIRDRFKQRHRHETMAGLTLLWRDLHPAHFGKAKERSDIIARADPAYDVCGKRLGRGGLLEIRERTKRVEHNARFRARPV